MIIKEVNAALYPWDLSDEGIKSCLDKLVGEANLNSIYLVGIMHKEKRPLTSMFYTHNPIRKYYLPEDSRLCYRIDKSKFKGMKMQPMDTERDFLKDIDWLDVMTKEAREIGLKTGLEISHTFYDIGIAKEKFPETLQQRFDGSKTGFYCLNNKAVLEYIKVLYAESVRNHDIDYIQTCMRVFETKTVEYTWHMDKNSNHPLRELMGSVLGTCFCDSCREKAIEMGYDWEGIIREISELYEIAKVGYAQTGKTMEQHLYLTGNMSETGLLLQYPGLLKWLDFKSKSIANVFKELNAAIKKVKPSIEFRYNNDDHREDLIGLRYDLVKDYIDGIRVSDYIEQRGNVTEEDYLDKKRNLMKVRGGIGFEKDLFATVAIRPNATPEIIRKSLMHLSHTGIDGLSLAHYDGSQIMHLKAIKLGMEEAGIVVRK